ncbi:hypothetical protein EVAR_99657_1 [Eumeta japonica]|uniref:Uncharacterized protein n=1 Tax=Eumeta variegata TaxID=151549 RepID=A0A4C1ZJK2_EUMVA|nr:hypothetical protein EVAR_99657_1 [Eumeta japonica]
MERNLRTEVEMKTNKRTVEQLRNSKQQNVMTEKITAIPERGYENRSNVGWREAADGAGIDRVALNVNGSSCAGAAACNDNRKQPKISDCTAGKCNNYVTKDAGRRRAVPVLYSRGSHYQVGYDVVSDQTHLTEDRLTNDAA